MFTPDAVIDYTEMGGPRGDLRSTKAYLAKVLPTMRSYQHLVGTTSLTVEGDMAHGRTICHNPMVLGDGAFGTGDDHVFWCGLWYRDSFVRTPDGWRIQERYEERSYLHGLPVPS